jgi:hypothetical protein
MNGPSTTRIGLTSFIMPFVSFAVLLLAVAVSRDAAFRHDALVHARASQDAQLATLHQVKIQLDNVGRETALLASQGNAHAAGVVQELRRRGVAIDPNAPRVQP